MSRGFRCFPVDPSPFPEAFTCLLCPSCWNEAGICLCALQWPSEFAEPFAEVVQEGMSLADLVEALPMEAGMRLDFSVSAGVMPVAPHLPIQSPSGTLIQVAMHGAPFADLPSAQQVLANPALERWGRENELNPSIVEDVWLVIGPNSEQLVVYGGREELHSLVARACDIHLRELSVVFCHGTFAPIAVRSVVANKMLAARPQFTPRRRPAGRILFLDARELGLPVSACSFHKLEVDLEDILAALDFVVPAGFRMRASSAGLGGSIFLLFVVRL